jgi:hypothetical protein
MNQPAPERIYRVTETQFSVARFYGGCKFGGHSYIYDPAKDELIRDDIHKREQAAIKKHAAEDRKRKKANTPKASDLFF